jgi:hypothetical protein
MVSGYKEAMHMRDTALHQANCANCGEQRLRAQVHLIQYSPGFQKVFLSHFIMLFFGSTLVTASLRMSVYPTARAINAKFKIEIAYIEDAAETWGRQP